MRPTYVIAGGYTAGHITPGLAVAAALREARPDLGLLFMGAEGGMEEAFVQREGLAFTGLKASPWVGQQLRGRARTLRKLGPAVMVARQKLRDYEAVGLVGLGSFVSVAPGLAAWSLGLPVTLYEPNARLGMANRLLLPFSTRLLVSGLFEANNTSLDVGVPLRTPLTELATTPPSVDGEHRLLVLGGSLGNPFFNEHLPATLSALAAHTGRPLRVVHQCGHAVHHGPIAERYRATGITAEVYPFIPNLGPRLAEAHLVISTAGAISLNELASAGVPALITPLAGVAEKHQLANARAFARATGSLVRSQSDWQPAAVVTELAGLLGDPARWRRHSDALRQFARPRATRDFLDAILPDLPPAK